MPSLDLPAQPEGRLRLHYLDGLRGLAALYVVFHHAWSEISVVPGWLPARWCYLQTRLPDARLAVQIFIVLSGYCLMLPVARSGTLKGGILAFIKRRAQRILPPYYAALALSLGLIALVPGMGTPQGLRWDIVLPAGTPGVLISHLLLGQDLRADWIAKINHPMWTIAQEWQIYFVFALVLLPLWRWAGILAAVGFSLAVSVAIEHFPGHDFRYAAPQFLFLFGMGMFAAVVSFPGTSRWLQAMQEKTPWGLLMALVWALYGVIVVRHHDPLYAASLRTAGLVAGAVFCLLVFCTSSSRHAGGGPLLLRLFEARPVVVLGAFSYSLYLVHAPILALCTLALHRQAVPGVAALWVEWLVAVPAATAIAYAFHLAAERPFMRGHPRSLPRAEKAAVLDTAP